jgi:hypothetical protein
MLDTLDNKPLIGQLLNAEDVIAFALAGNATLTLKSIKTGCRFTYKIRRPAERGPVRFFISLMNGPDNERSFAYLGQVYNEASGLRYVHGRKSKIGAGCASNIAFDWFWKHVIGKREMPSNLEVWHAGSCGRCGRTLTVPESIKSGFGPECITKIGRN